MWSTPALVRESDAKIISEIFAGGLHEYLTEFLESMEDLSTQIQQSFFSARVVE